MWGLILAHVVTACQLLIIVLYMFSARVSVLKPTPALETILKVANPLKMDDVVTLLTIAVLIWILVSCRRTDWARWVQPDAKAPAQGEVSSPHNTRHGRPSRTRSARTGS